MKDSRYTIEEMKELIAARQVGFDVDRRLRDEALPNTDTWAAVVQLDEVFNMAVKLPLRESSGLIEWAKYMAKRG